MICGTIPTLRPLFRGYGNKTQSQGVYQNADSPYFIAPSQSIPPKTPARGFNSVFSAGKTKYPYPATTSTSEENIVATHELNYIRRTVEVEISNEGVGSTGRGREHDSWSRV